MSKLINHFKRKKHKAKVKVPSAYLDPSMQEIQDFLENDNDMIQLPGLIKDGSQNGQSGGSNNSMPNYPTYHGPQANYGNAAEWYSTPACSHKGEKVIFEHDGKQLFASSWQGLDEYSDEWNLIIDLAGNVTPVKAFQEKFVKALSNFPMAAELEKMVVRPQPLKISAQLLSLNWADMGVPPVGLDFWQALWAALPPKTVIACMGGHGRTGTALAAFMIVGGGVDYWDAVEMVKSKHCHKAIETLSQESYLHKLYVEKLNFDLAVAVFENREEDVIDLRADLKYAQETPPTAATSKGSKTVYIPPATHTSGQNTAWGEVITSRLTDAGWEDQRCTKSGCSIVRCIDMTHLTWVPKALETVGDV